MRRIVPYAPLAGRASGGGSLYLFILPRAVLLPGGAPLGRSDLLAREEKEAKEARGDANRRPVLLSAEEGGAAGTAGGFWSQLICPRVL